MKPEALRAAIAEAQRFISAAHKLDKVDNIQLCRNTDEHYYDAPKLTAATHRASMDLTRALSELRKRS